MVASETPGARLGLPDIEDRMNAQQFETTADLKIPPQLVDQVIGQDDAVKVIRKAAEQKRHVILIGDPGTGKSMLARSMVDFLPKGDLQDVIAYHNPDDPNEPKVRIVPSGKGKEIVHAQKLEAEQKRAQKNSWMFMLLFGFIALSAIMFMIYKDATLLLIALIGGMLLFMVFRYTGQRKEAMNVPKLLITHKPDEMPPFIDATGAHAGPLLGDV